MVNECTQHSVKNATFLLTEVLFVFVYEYKHEHTSEEVHKKGVHDHLALSSSWSYKRHSGPKWIFLRARFQFCNAVRWHMINPL